MNNDLEGFGQWRRGVDSRLGTLETRVAEEASLRATMDEDVSKVQVEFRAQRGLLQSLHLTQQEHTALLREHGALLRDHGALLRDHGALLRDHSTQLTELRSGQQRIMAGVDAIRTMLDRALSSGND